MSKQSLVEYFKGQGIEASLPNGSYLAKLSPPNAVENAACWDVLERYFDLKLASEDKHFVDYKVQSTSSQTLYYVADLNPSRLLRIQKWSRLYRFCLIFCFLVICVTHFLVMPLAHLLHFF
jgi:hypothetical protein